MLHERISRELLQCAVSGTEPLMTPLEKQEYDAYRAEILKNRAKGWNPVYDIPTDLPESGVEFSYGGKDAVPMPLSRIREIDAIARKIVGWYEARGIVCEDGRFTIGIQSADPMLHITAEDAILIPEFGSACADRLTGWLAYGITALIMKNFNGREDYHNSWIEDRLCRVMSAVLLRAFGYAGRADAAAEGQDPEAENWPKKNYFWYNSGKEGPDVKALADSFRPSDAVPVIRYCDYIETGTNEEERDLNTGALLKNYPESAFIRILCDECNRRSGDAEDHLDYTWGGNPFDDDE